MAPTLRFRFALPFAFAATIAMALPLVAVAASFTPYRIVDPDPGVRINIRNASPDGRFLVGLRTTQDGRSEAIRWSEAGGVERLGSLPGEEDYSESVASSFDGSRIAGFAHDLSHFPQAFLWDEAEGMRALESSPTTDFRSSRVTSMTPDGSTIVGSRAIDGLFIPVVVSIPYDHAFRWTEADGFVPLIRSSGRLDRSVANDVSDDGSTIVGTLDLEGASRGFVWRAGGSYQLLEGPGGDGTGVTVATVVSGDGSTVAGRASIGSTGWTTFLWSSDLGIHPLTFGSGTDVTGIHVRDISFDGSLVVGSLSQRSAGNVAFIWDADHGVRRLDEYLSSLGVDLDGLVPMGAISILADGRSIFGTALDPVRREVVPFIAVIPEPGPAVLIGLGLLGLRAARPALPRTGPIA